MFAITHALYDLTPISDFDLLRDAETIECPICHSTECDMETDTERLGAYRYLCYDCGAISEWSL